jgi:hypothetical protein
MVSSLDLMSNAQTLPEGIQPGAERGALITGRLVGLDPDAGIVQVSVNDSDPIWVPAVPGIYTPDGPVRLLRSPIDGGKITTCTGPVQAGQPIVGGVVKTVNSGVGQLVVTALNQDWTLPYNPGTYSAGTAVHVLRSEAQYGRPVFVQGPSGNFNHASPGQPGGGAANPGQLVDRQAVLVPVWSGSWRSSFSRWDSWNTDRHGGRSTLWQGNGFGSGPMIGLAGYGDQILALGAQQITRMQVSVYRADNSSSGGKVPVLQPSPHGGFPGGAPTVSPAAAVAGPALAFGQAAQVDLPSSVFEGFRVGSFKGIATVGSDYAGFSGTPDRAPVHADGMALVVQYKVLA